MYDDMKDAVKEDVSYNRLEETMSTIPCVAPI